MCEWMTEVVGVKGRMKGYVAGWKECVGEG